MCNIKVELVGCVLGCLQVYNSYMTGYLGYLRYPGLASFFSLPR